jgi:hypothetical protein
MLPGLNFGRAKKLIGNGLVMAGISGWPDGETLPLDRELRSVALTVLTRTLLPSELPVTVTRRPPVSGMTA